METSRHSTPHLFPTQKGLATTVSKYLLAGDDLADDMLARLRPRIPPNRPRRRKGFAQTGVHSNWMNNLFIPIEEKASKTHLNPCKPIVYLLDAIQPRDLARKTATDRTSYMHVPEIAQDSMGDREGVSEPKKVSGWEEIEERVEDDGHAARVVRALAHGQRIWVPFEGRAEA
ncbi:hypothetical protein EJ03DRAFT_355100 [Teratosphaeria nubilosa]|uniref:Uncharacterized protein n=1 Tax=Teratosphaeria nubilosa TaxID=161662 RepID=A0A6G1KYC2_9PEZI|nr:hypothetical protein EJ03DRAFT_355100 [Teratosphaeria nubilosa]